ncbi:MAG: sporulation regulator WhiA, partial [Defluviitaleaceae bacterium]|nr:sporulation regulator WhiA [Defluviitaleaceae bacterium]
EIARLRLENENLSLTEIGELTNPPIGKSGVNHRLRKICKIAEALRREVISK